MFFFIPSVFFGFSLYVNIWLMLCLVIGPVLFGRPSYGGRGVTNRQFLVQRNEGSHRSDSVEILIGCLFYVFLVLLFIFLGMWIRRRTLIRRKSMEWEERQRRLQDVERARYSHGL